MKNQIDHLAYFVKNEVITPAENTFIVGHSNTYVFI